MISYSFHIHYLVSDLIFISCSFHLQLQTPEYTSKSVGHGVCIVGHPWIVLGHPYDQWIGLDRGTCDVFGSMSVDSPGTSIGPVDWIGPWDVWCVWSDVRG